jgi:hypothetical protein
MKVRIRFIGMPDSLSMFENGKESQVDFAGDTLKDLLDYLLLKISHKKKNIFFDDQGDISPELFTLINGRLATDSNRLRQRLHENDLIEILPAPGG